MHPKKPPVYLLPVASSLHVERVQPFIERARKLLEQEGFRVEGPKEPVTDTKDLRITGQNGLLLVFLASGGSSEVAVAASWGRRALLWAYPSNNSLPSALSARSKLRRAGAWRGEIIYGSLDSLPEEVLWEARAITAQRELRNLRLGVLCDKRKWSSLLSTYGELTGIFEMNIQHIGFSELEQQIRQIDEEKAAEEAKTRLQGAMRENIEESGAVAAFKLYLALRRIIDERGFSGVAVDCFWLIGRLGLTPCLALSLLLSEGLLGVCEADLASAIAMKALATFSEKPAWMANLSQVDFKKATLTLAHCTAPINLTKKAGGVRLTPHFESGLPLSLDVGLPRGLVTLTELQSRPARLIASLAVLEESSLKLAGTCRTQARVKLLGGAEALRRLLSLVGRHLVLAYGDHLQPLERLCARLDIEFVRV